MKRDEIIKEIDKMELSEKLLLVEDIWDSIARSNAVLPIHEWQKAELDRRYKEHKNGSLHLHNWKEVHEDLRNKYK
jgi:putative addiction module component (TIGR02574 family)